ncbi:FHA domain-containing protein [Plantactinospora sp. S1510]|uniref:FHA domain-containing protein n=1 Tax=Plantactinospora alkalitolerans TaxID=2789879 RepID=A0ABS0H051_9ACTN|nr:FHA domain-containing protein [Plantactinospora alkalitolerans]MBF9131831.1 FHA domain-containing protein [Plantactinospora alkalitolerans]
MTIREPDPAAPFVSVLLIPHHAVDPAAPETVDLSPPGTVDLGSPDTVDLSVPETVDLSVPDTEPIGPQPALVEGVDCKRGHFNDPALRFCQQCGIAMHQLTLVTRRGPRPPLGVLLLDDGMTFRLDTDYVLGRAPDSDDEVAAGRARPLRITGDAPGVSRRHLRVVLAGWRVHILDLGSANGTDVRPPETSSPHWLGAGTAIPIEPGTRVLFGSRWLRYESHRNR